MSTALLHKAYSGSIFQKEGVDLVTQIAQHLDQTLSGKSAKVIQWKEPQEEYEFWKQYSESTHATSDLSLIHI